MTPEERERLRRAGLKLPMTGSEMWSEWGPRTPQLDTLPAQPRLPDIGAQKYPGKQFTPEDENDRAEKAAFGVYDAMKRVRGDAESGVASRIKPLQDQAKKDWARKIIGGLSSSDYGPAAQTALRTGAHIIAGEPWYSFDQPRDRSSTLDPYKLSYLDLQNERLRLAREKESRMAEHGQRYLGLGEKREERLEEKHYRIPDVDRRKMDMQANALSHLEELKHHIDLGRIGPVWGRIRSAMIDIGIGDPDLARDNATLIAMFASYVKSISGVAVSEKEFRRLYPSLPNIKQSPEMFKELADRFEKQIRNEYINTLEGLRISGRDVTGFELKEGGRQPAIGGGTGRMPQEGDLKFHDPKTGQHWSIPNDLPPEEIDRFKAAHPDAIQIMNIGE